jgi:hypothetical protein
MACPRVGYHLSTVRQMVAVICIQRTSFFTLTPAFSP